MGVYIKGMEMPKDGVYWCEIGVAGDIATITIHGEERKSFPLVPVPPHGRLIDADEADEYAYDELEVSYGYLSPREASRNMQLIYRHMPTVIPAEAERSEK